MLYARGEGEGRQEPSHKGARLVTRDSLACKPRVKSSLAAAQRLNQVQAIFLDFGACFLICTGKSGFAVGKVQISLCFAKQSAVVFYCACFLHLAILQYIYIYTDTVTITAHNGHL